MKRWMNWSNSGTEIDRESGIEREKKKRDRKRRGGRDIQRETDRGRKTERDSQRETDREW